MNPVGLEPTIPGSVGRCLIHWATGPIDHLFQIDFKHFADRTNRNARAASSLLHLSLNVAAPLSSLASKVGRADVNLVKPEEYFSLLSHHPR